MNMSRKLPAFVAGLFAILTTAASAAPMSPEEVVRAYADAASRRDVEALLALYAPDVRKYRFPGELASEGREYNRERYKKNFADNPNLTVKIIDLMVLGDKVASRDVVTGLSNGKTAEELVVYQITGGQISHIVYVERQLR
jgi:uncharacterized protein (TIGR02246 family)